MMKLLVMLVSFLLLALAILGIRQHRLEVTSQTSRLIDQIEQRKHELWDQDPKITETSNPLALAQNLKSRGLVGDIGVKDKREADTPGDLIAPLRRRH